jgi:hypothetical protein
MSGGWQNSAGAPRPHLDEGMRLAYQAYLSETKQAAEAE